MNSPDRRCYQCNIVLTKGKTFYHTYNGQFNWACPVHYIPVDNSPIINASRYCRQCNEPKLLDAEHFSPMPDGTKATGTNRKNLMWICKKCENQRGVI